MALAGAPVVGRAVGKAEGETLGRAVGRDVALAAAGGGVGGGEDKGSDAAAAEVDKNRSTVARNVTRTCEARAPREGR